MENGAVYGPTTEEDPGPARGARRGLASCFSASRLPWQRWALKGSQLLLSLLAFICEEVVSQCTLCGGLYLFEFVSCSAFLLSLLIVIVYCTPVYDRVDHVKVKSSSAFKALKYSQGCHPNIEYFEREEECFLLLEDFYITLGTGCVFLLASIIFVATHDKTSAEIAAIDLNISAIGLGFVDWHPTHKLAHVFGFLASFMFLIDFFTMLCEKRQESKLRKPETTNKSEALTEPLNA